MPVEKLPVAEMKKFLMGYSQTFRSLDRLMSLLRVDLDYQGDIVLRVEGRYARAGGHKA